jgi:hypothetical protein
MTPENLIKREICAWLRSRGIFFWVNDSHGFWHEGRKRFLSNKDPYRIKGISDILGILPGGRFLAVEVKSKTGRLSPEQKAFIGAIQNEGGMAFMARSVEEVKEQLSYLEKPNAIPGDYL